MLAVPEDFFHFLHPELLMLEIQLVEKILFRLLDKRLAFKSASSFSFNVNGITPFIFCNDMTTVSME